MTRLLAKKLTDKGIHVYSQHPGFINTNLGESAGLFVKFIFKLFGKSPQKGAVNLLYICNTP